jgi:hypothetical protein
MGQVPAKYMLPSSPYGTSPASNVLSPTQPAAANPQTPLLPPNFQSGGTLPSGSAPAVAANPFTPIGAGSTPGMGARNPLLKGMFGLQ